MGGAAFPALDVLRLSHDEWSHLCDEIISALKVHFTDVACPEPAPGKVDHGDLDILVCNPKAELAQDTVLKAISAAYSTTPGVTTSYAVPFPGKDGKYAQVDVQHCKNGYLNWNLWCSAYGDLVQILGVLNRKIGLTINDKGLNLRVEEWEATNRNLSMVFLTKEPCKVMEFLGLDSQKWRQGFNTQDEIFSWCSMGRFYSRPVKKMIETAGDRARLKKRPMFSTYLEVWVPEHPEAWQDRKTWPRKRVLEEAIKYFQKEKEYDALMSAYAQRERYNELVENVKTSIPVGKSKGQRTIIRGIKRWVDWQNGVSRLLPENMPNDREDAPAIPAWLEHLSDQRMPDFMIWLQDNYVEIRTREDQWAVSRREHSCPHINHTVNTD